jgi:hypothetical protein
MQRGIALWTSLCLVILIVVSGPHLVHHLVDLSADHPHSHTNQPQSTDCLVLALMQYSPLVADVLAPPPAPFLSAEQASSELPWQAVKPRSLTFHARSPPVWSHL